MRMGYRVIFFSLTLDSSVGYSLCQSGFLRCPGSIPGLARGRLPVSFRLVLFKSVRKGLYYITVTSHERYGVSDYRQLDCLLITGNSNFCSSDCLGRHQNSESRVVGPFWEESGNRWIPSQRANNGLMSWCHHKLLNSMSPYFSSHLILVTLMPT